jgi:hypothetical protein
LQRLWPVAGIALACLQWSRIGRLGADSLATGAALALVWTAIALSCAVLWLASRAASQAPSQSERRDLVPLYLGLPGAVGTALLLTTAAEILGLVADARFDLRWLALMWTVVAAEAWALLLCVDARRGSRLRGVLVAHAGRAALLVAALILVEGGASWLASHSGHPVFARAGGSAAAIERNRGAPGALHFGFPLNAGGFHDEAQALELGADLRVALVADSFGFGIVSHREHFATVAERRLAQRTTRGGPRISILNMGIPAIGPREYELLIASEVEALAPERVIVALFVGNDLIESRFDRPKRYSLRQWWIWRIPERLVVTLLEGRAAADESVSVVAREAVPAGPAGSAVGEPLGHSAAEVERPTFSEATFTRIESDRLDALFSQDSGGVYEALFRILGRIHARLGPRLALVLIPDQFQVDDGLLDQLLRHREHPLEAPIDRPQARIMAWARERGIPVLDLLPALREAQAREATYHLRDTHWNAAGNRVAGEALARFLESWLGLAPVLPEARGAESAEESRPAAARREG